MPSLIRLLVLLLILAGLVFGGMVALVAFVDPGEKDVTIKIPARELAPAAGAGTGVSSDSSDLPAPVNVAPKDTSSDAPDESSLLDDTGADQPGVKTVIPGGAE
jgi:hypothetical protein